MRGRIRPTPSRRSMRNHHLLVNLLPVVLVCTFGITMRFANLGGKLCYLDEAGTALRVSGHTVGEFCDYLEGAGAVSPDEVRRFQRIDPSRGVADTVKVLLLDEPQHPPLFYAWERCWAGMTGDSMAWLRAGAAWLSLLALPGLAWLGRELWREQATTRAALALWSVSPFFVTYAQDAREYGLWSSLTILATAALLQAVRTSRRWWCYGLFATAGIYTTLLFAPVLAAHGMWLAGDRQARSRWRGFLATMAVTAIAFSPWVIGGYGQRANGLDQVAWIQAPRSLVDLMRAWSFGIGAVVFDPRGFGAIGRVVAAVIAAAVVGGAILWWRSPERRGAALVLLLVAVNAVPLAGADVLFGGCRSTVPRFLVATWVGELLVLAWIGSRERWLLAAALALGVSACLIRWPAETWWNKYSGPRHAALAAEINRCRAPLLLAVPHSHHFNLLLMSHLLDDHVRLGPRSLAPVPGAFSDIFVLLRPEVSADDPPPAGATMVLNTGGEQLWRIPTATADGAAGVTTAVPPPSAGP